jgi:hypothetical protein
MVDIILGRGGWGKQERAGFGRPETVSAKP